MEQTVTGLFPVIKVPSEERFLEEARGGLVIIEFIDGEITVGLRGTLSAYDPVSHGSTVYRIHGEGTIRNIGGKAPTAAVKFEGIIDLEDPAGEFGSITLISSTSDPLSALMPSLILAYKMRLPTDDPFSDFEANIPRTDPYEESQNDDPSHESLRKEQPVENN